MRSASLESKLAPFEAYDPEFVDVVGEAPRLVKLAETDAHEGPVYVAGEDALYFTTLPRGGNVAIRRLRVAGGEIETVVPRTRLANGMTSDRDGGVVVCEQGTLSEHARIARLDPATGLLETVVDSFRGLRLNSPNDVVVRSDRTIWFTDPTYGFLQGSKPEPQLGDHVYRYDPERDRLAVVADLFDKPNGLAFSPDERTLYVGDSGANQDPGSYDPRRPHRIVAFDVERGRLTNARLFAVTVPGFPDGLKVDSEGRVYASALSGVQVFNTSGDLIGEIRLPGAVNFTWGGADRDVLLITADTAVWAAHLAAKGA